MFYSNSLFGDADGEDDKNAPDPTRVTALIGAVNFAATLGGLVLLSKFGRKSIMFTCSVLMAIVLIGLGVSSL